jgi:hypothetical protein
MIPNATICQFRIPRVHLCMACVFLLLFLYNVQLIFVVHVMRDLRQVITQ